MAVKGQCVLVCLQRNKIVSESEQRLLWWKRRLQMISSWLWHHPVPPMAQSHTLEPHPHLCIHHMHFTMNKKHWRDWQLVMYYRSCTAFWPVKVCTCRVSLLASSYGNFPCRMPYWNILMLHTLKTFCNTLCNSYTTILESHMSLRPHPCMT